MLVESRLFHLMEIVLSALVSFDLWQLASDGNALV